MRYSSAAGPQPQAVLFVLSDKDDGVRCLLLATGLCRPVLARLRLPTRRWAKMGIFSARSLLLTSVFLTSCLRAPSATGPKVVSPTVAPRSLGPIFERGVASTLWAPLASRSATLQAGRRDGSQRSTVRAHLRKSCTPVEEAKFFMFKPLVRAQIIRFTFWR